MKCNVYARTESGESQLSAGHLSIKCTPEVITHRTPLLVVADLHTSLIRIHAGTSQSHVTLCADCIQERKRITESASNIHINQSQFLKIQWNLCHYGQVDFLGLKIAKDSGYL